MKAWEAEKSFQQLVQHLGAAAKTGGWMGVYLLYGEERFLRKFYADKLLKALGGEIGDMNTNVFEGKGADTGKIIDQAETMPFLAERRVILLRETGLVKAGSDALARYLEEPSPHTVFLFTENEVSETCKLYKTIRERGLAAEIGQQGEAYLLRNIAAFLKRDGKRMTEDDARYLLKKTGADMATLNTELEKLVTYAMDRSEITAEDIDAVCSQTVEDKIFEMIGAIVAGDAKQAMALYEDLLTLKEPPMKILVLLSRQYLGMLQVRSLREQGEVRETIVRRLATKSEENPSPKLRPFQVDQYLRQSANLPAARLQEAVCLCAEADELIKGGKMPDRIAVERLMMRLTI